ncbi:MAG: BsuPI-related putative proteinase inhibitor [Acidobacteriota bacterium]
MALFALVGSAQTETKSDDSFDSTEILLPPDYLPLRLGNRWFYSKTDSRFKKSDDVKIEIISRPIIKWKTWYVFNQLPFVPGLEGANNVLVRYDDETRRFVRLTQEGEVVLFPVGFEKDSEFAASVDEKQQVVPNRFSYLTCLSCADSGTEVVFDRGVGVVAAAFIHPWGTESFELTAADVDGRHFGEPIKQEKPSAKTRRQGPVISRADPRLSLTVEKTDLEARLSLKVRNPTDSFLSLFFDTSQTYDFVIREKETGLEIWRWSKGSFFSRVRRNVALRPEEVWSYTEVWNFKDNERNDIKQGVYEVTGVLATREPIFSEPIDVAAP